MTTSLEARVLQALREMVAGDASRMGRQRFGVVRKVRRDGTEIDKIVFVGQPLKLHSESVEVGRIRSGCDKLAIPVRFRAEVHRSLGGGVRRLEWILISDDPFALETVRFGLNVPAMPAQKPSDGTIVARWREWRDHECGFVKGDEIARRGSRLVIEWDDGVQFEDEITDGLAVFLTPAFPKSTDAVAVALYNASGDVLTRRDLALS
jgi:hypothetical protein